MSRIKPEDTIIASEYKTNPERFYANLRKLAFIVLHNHYNFIRDSDTQEDLVSCAVIKAIELSQSGTFDESRSNLRTYLYSGMRNEMQNYVYKHSKLVYVSDVYYDQDTGYYDYDDPRVDDDVIYDLCDRFDRLGNYHNHLIRRLKSYGLAGDLTDLPEVENPDPFILDALFIGYIWRVLHE